MADNTGPLLKNSKNGYRLQEGDVDLQGTARNPLHTLEVAQKKAIEKLREYTGLELKLSDFVPVLWGVAYFQSSTKRIPTQLELRKEVPKGVWDLELNMDHPALPDPQVGKKPSRGVARGPDRPHVGYEAKLIGMNGNPVKEHKGHIFVDDIAAGRPEVRKEKKNALFSKPR